METPESGLLFTILVFQVSVFFVSFVVQREPQRHKEHSESYWQGSAGLAPRHSRQPTRVILPLPPPPSQSIVGSPLISM